MSTQPETFYRFRGFNTTTLDFLYRDLLHFANPRTFNDPLDCNPSVVCDSNRSEMRDLLGLLIQRRVTSEVLASLQLARLKGEGASRHAERRARIEDKSSLENIAYHATDPEYSAGEDQAEAWLLTSQIEEELRRHYDRGVCCFSASYRSPLLWSHYGDQHRGLCIGYGVDRVPRPIPQRVVYGGNRTINTSVLIRAFLHNDHEAGIDLDRDILLRKAAGWRYENEWRLIGTEGLQNSPMLLKEITFGIRCEPAVIHAVVRALSGRINELKFYRMREDRIRFGLKRRGVDIDDLDGYFPETAASGEEIFGANDDSTEISLSRADEERDA